LASLEADGGMPDAGGMGRMLRTILVGLVVYNAEADNIQNNVAEMYSRHLDRMAAFLESKFQAVEAVKKIVEQFKDPSVRARRIEGRWSEYLGDASLSNLARRKVVLDEILVALTK
jgi:hypothetical protein